MDNLPIQPYDIVMLVVLALTTLFGLWKGMAWQLASLGSVAVSCFVALRFSGMLAPHISDQEWNRFAAMLILYLGTSLSVWLVFRLVAGIIDRVRLKEFDRQMGALFGLAKGCLLCLIITFFAVTLSETLRQAVLKSKSGHYIAIAIHKTAPAMPQEVRDRLGKYIDELDQKLDPNTPLNAQSDKPLETLIDKPLETLIGDTLGDTLDGNLPGDPPPVTHTVSDSTLAPLDYRSWSEEIVNDISNQFQDTIGQRVDTDINQFDSNYSIPSPVDHQPWSEKLVSDIGNHVQEEIGNRVDAGINQFNERLETTADKFGYHPNDEIHSIPDGSPAPLTPGIQTSDFSRWIEEPDETATLVALPNYRVASNDVLKIRQNAPSGTAPGPVDGLYRVGRDGTLDLGSFGTLNVAGQRLVDVENQVEWKVAQSSPRTDLLLELGAAESEVYYVITSTAAQETGAKRLRATGRETIADALRNVGASPYEIDKIWMIRPPAGGVGVERVLPIEWNAAQGTLSPNYMIEPGDAVFVAERNSRWASNSQGLVGAWLEWLRR